MQRTGCKTRTIQGVRTKSDATTAGSLAWEGRKERLCHGGPGILTFSSRSASTAVSILDSQFSAFLGWLDA
ncbi:MAG: hypothetical protein HA492_05715 [Candidatus Verstraetearchaeota archaeon]|nr:hypothetical protein [Candidatus Verstraetearchaeota archaeon]